MQQVCHTGQRPVFQQHGASLYDVTSHCWLPYNDQPSSMC